MADDNDQPEDGGDEEPSFRERLEQARERAEDDPGEGGPRGPPEGGMGGNPFAQMMGGMMGGGLGGDMRGEQRETAVARELTQLREDVQDLTAEVSRIADALEDDD